MFTWLRKALNSVRLRPVPGAMVCRDGNGRVLYNMLDPTMQQFMGRCVGAIKKAGIRAKGTAQFSILLGEQKTELLLDRYWENYVSSSNESVFEDIVQEAKKLTAR